MRLFAVTGLLCAATLLRAELIDRLAITIGNQAITESQIDEELRVTALLNHGPLVRSSETRRNAAARMIEQFLIKREIEVSRFPLPSSQEVDVYQTQVEQDFGGADSLHEALRRYNLDPATLRAHLVQQLTTLRFVSFRFQPEVAAADHDSERRTDEALSIWLTEARKQVAIVYLDKALLK